MWVSEFFMKVWWWSSHRWLLICYHFSGLHVLLSFICIIVTVAFRWKEIRMCRLLFFCGDIRIRSCFIKYFSSVDDHRGNTLPTWNHLFIHSFISPRLVLRCKPWHLKSWLELTNYDLIRSNLNNVLCTCSP